MHKLINKSNYKNHVDMDEKTVNFALRALGVAHSTKFSLISLLFNCIVYSNFLE